MVSEATRGMPRPMSSSMPQSEERPCDLKTDAVDYLTTYARENPGYSALWCLGVGFVLGWKLKPW
jgi:hypothetical protein